MEWRFSQLRHYDPNGYQAQEFNEIEDLVDYIDENKERLFTETKKFVEQFPGTGDKEIDEYLRWYCTASIMNTKLLADGKIIVMSYLR